MFQVCLILMNNGLDMLYLLMLEVCQETIWKMDFFVLVLRLEVRGA